MALKAINEMIHVMNPGHFSWQIILMTIAMLVIDDSTMMRSIDDYDGDDDGKNRLKFLHGNSY